MSLEENLQRVVSRHAELGALLSGETLPSGQDFARLSKEYAELGPIVEAIGDGKLNTETGDRIPLGVAVGERVIFSSYAGTEIKLDGDELLIMSEDEILAIID